MDGTDIYVDYKRKFSMYCTVLVHGLTYMWLGGGPVRIEIRVEVGADHVQGKRMVWKVKDGCSGCNLHWFSGQMSSD